jgi:hypothetical protein
MWIVRTRRTLGNRHTVFIGEPTGSRHSPTKFLAVDVNRFVPTIFVFHAARHTRCEIGGKALREEIGWLNEV